MLRFIAVAAVCAALVGTSFGQDPESVTISARVQPTVDRSALAMKARAALALSATAPAEVTAGASIKPTCEPGACLCVDEFGACFCKPGACPCCIGKKKTAETAKPEPPAAIPVSSGPTYYYLGNGVYGTCQSGQCQPATQYRFRR